MMAGTERENGSNDEMFARTEYALRWVSDPFEFLKGVWTRREEERRRVTRRPGRKGATGTLCLISSGV